MPAGSHHTNRQWGRSAWDMINRLRSERKRRRGIIEDLLAQADQADRQAWVDQSWTEDRARRLLGMIHEADDDR